MSELSTSNRMLPERSDRLERPRSPVLRSSLTPAEEQREGIPVREYLSAVRRYAWLVVASVLLSCGLAAYKLSQKLPVYLASTAIRLVDPAVPMSGDLKAGGNTDQLPGWYTDPILSQIQVLKSRAVAGAVVDSLGLRFRPDRPDFPYRAIRGARVAAGARVGDTVAVEFGEREVTARSGKVVARAPYGAPLEIAGVRAVFAESPGLPSARFGIVSRDDAVSAILGGIQAQPREMTNVIDVAWMGHDPHLAQRVADATAVFFQRQNAESAQQESRRRRTFIQEQLRSTDSLLMVAQYQLSSFRKGVRAFSPREKFKATEEGLSGFRVKREELDQERRVYAQMNQELAGGGPQSADQLAALAASPSVASNGGFVSLYQQLIRYQTLRDSLTTGPWSRAGTNPDVVRLDSLIATSQSRLLRAVEARSTALAAQVRVLDEVMAGDAASIAGLPDAEAEEQRLGRQVETLQRLADDLLREQQKARIDEAVEAGEVEIVDHALVPGGPMGRGGTKRMLFALVIGLMIGGGGALLLDRMNTALVRREDVEGFLHLPALGVIPRIEAPGAPPKKRINVPGMALLPRRPGAVDTTGGGLITVTDLHSSGSQAYRKLRTHLIFSTAGDPLRTLMVTSPAASEGKSTVCSNLAVTFAQQNMRVALVDCDMRRSRLHSVFEVARTPGLTEVLAGRATLDEAIRPTAVEGLDLVPAGTLVPNISELLGAASMRRALAELSDRYDIVIVDTPPVLAAADAEILAVQCHAVLMVVRAGQTERHTAQYAVQQLRAIGSRVVGAVLNDPDEKVPGHSRYTYYYDYYADQKA